MIQLFWAIDFVGIFLSRLIIAFIFFDFFVKYLKIDKILAFIYLISALLIFLGLYSSIVAISWIIIFILKLFNEKQINSLYLSLISYLILLLSVGPGKLSLDRFFDIRYF
jgi:hypothetical protein